MEKMVLLGTLSLNQTVVLTRYKTTCAHPSHVPQLVHRHAVVTLGMQLGCWGVAHMVER